MKETKFKQTEVGMIPNDWNLVEISELAKDMADGPFGSNLKKEHYTSDSQVRIIQLSNIGECGWENENTKYTTFEHAKTIARCIVPKEESILVAKMMPAGRAIICPKTEKQYILGSDVIRITANEKLNSKYFVYATKSQAYLKQISDNTQGSTRQRTSISKLRKIAMPLPIFKEQQRIANALSDVDTLIANLEKLIAKKKNIKQGAMQQLLTGKKRLPGFAPDERQKECLSERSAKREVEESSGYKMTELGLIPSDWENVNISKTCTIKARIGWQGLKSTEYLNSGDYILVTGTDFKNGFIDWSTCSYVSEWRFKQDKNIQIKKGDVLVTKDGTIGKVAFLNEIPMEGTLNSGVFVVRSKDLKKIDSVYLSLVFKSSWFDNFLDEITSGSTIVHLYQKDFVKFNFPIPSSIEEQTAIANVLSDMDAEISALETKLAKYRTLKTGMMQQLLTGKIRLV